jgi:hypothetical protein
LNEPGFPGQDKAAGRSSPPFFQPLLFPAFTFSGFTLPAFTARLNSLPKNSQEVPKGRLRVAQDEILGKF